MQAAAFTQLSVVKENLQQIDTTDLTSLRSQMMTIKTPMGTIYMLSVAFVTIDGTLKMIQHILNQDPTTVLNGFLTLVSATLNFTTE